MQRALGLESCGFGVFYDEGRNTFNQSVLKSLGDRPAAPLKIFFLFAGAAVAAKFLSDVQQCLGGIGAGVVSGEGHVADDVLNSVSQFRWQVVVNSQLTGVNDAHIEAGFNGVIQEYRVDGFPNRVVAAEREGHIGYAA